MVEDHTSVTLVNLHKSELLEEISNQLSMGSENLMEDDRYLLECILLTLATSNGKEQEYWLLTIEAARMASLIWQQQAHQQGTIGTTWWTGINFINFLHYFIASLHEQWISQANSLFLEGENALPAVPTATLLCFSLWCMKTLLLVKLV